MKGGGPGAEVGAVEGVAVEEEGAAGWVVVVGDESGVFADFYILAVVGVEEFSGGFGGGLSTWDEFAGAEFEGVVVSAGGEACDGDGEDEEDDEDAEHGGCWVEIFCVGGCGGAGEGLVLRGVA